MLAITLLLYYMSSLPLGLWWLCWRSSLSSIILNLRTRRRKCGLYTWRCVCVGGLYTWKCVCVGLCSVIYSRVFLHEFTHVYITVAWIWPTNTNAVNYCIYALIHSFLIHSFLIHPFLIHSFLIHSSFIHSSFIHSSFIHSSWFHSSWFHVRIISFLAKYWSLFQSKVLVCFCLLVFICF